MFLVSVTLTRMFLVSVLFFEVGDFNIQLNKMEDRPEVTLACIGRSNLAIDLMSLTRD